MTRHELYPDWIKLNYTSNGRQKRALWPVIIDGTPTAGLEPSLRVRVGSAIPATTCVSNMIAVIAWLFHTDATFDSYEVFHKATLTSPPIFIYSAPLGLPGTSSVLTVPYNEFVMTFKTPEPGGLKLYFMETIVANDVKHALPSPSDPNITALLDFMLGNDAFIFGRNNNLPIAGINYTSKQNDFYRRKYKL